jgi:hypothetical protein
MNIDYVTAMYFKQLHQVLTLCAKKYVDIGSMNEAILELPALDKNKDVVQTLSRTSDATIKSIMLQAACELKEKHKLDVSLEFNKSAEELKNLFADYAIMAFNLRAIEAACEEEQK